MSTNKYYDDNVDIHQVLEIFEKKKHEIGEFDIVANLNYEAENYVVYKNIFEDTKQCEIIKNHIDLVFDEFKKEIRDRTDSLVSGVTTDVSSFASGKSSIQIYAYRYI